MSGIDTPQSARSRPALLEQAWIWSVVGYTVLRFVVAWGAFGEHGANVWIFGLLDVGTAWPYAKAIAVICRRTAACEWRKLPVPIAVALVSFFAPYAYLWFAAGEMPASLRAGLMIFVAVLFGAAVLGVWSKARALRAASDEPTRTTGVATDDLVIDLRSGEARIDRRSGVAMVDAQSRTESVS